MALTANFNELFPANGHHGADYMDYFSIPPGNEFMIPLTKKDQDEPEIDE